MLRFKSGVLRRDANGEPQLTPLVERVPVSHAEGVYLTGQAAFQSIDVEGLVFAGVRDEDTSYWLSRMVFNMGRPVWANGRTL